VTGDVLTAEAAETKIRSAAYYGGLTLGWELAGAFGKATCEEKRRILARPRRMSDSYNPLVQGIWTGINDRAECRYDARKAGLDVRQICTDRLAAAVERLS
jgi:hypothetical protein